MIKSIYEKFQETSGIIRFPSLIIWISMYHLCLVRHLQFLEPFRFHMWHFKPFSMVGTPQELEEAKLFLENWFQNLKVQTTRWRVPQNIRICLPSKAHIRLELTTLQSDIHKVPQQNQNLSTTIQQSRIFS